MLSPQPDSLYYILKIISQFARQFVNRGCSQTQWIGADYPLNVKSNHARLGHRYSTARVSKLAPHRSAARPLARGTVPVSRVRFNSERIDSLRCGKLLSARSFKREGTSCTSSNFIWVVWRTPRI